MSLRNEINSRIYYNAHHQLKELVIDRIKNDVLFRVGTQAEYAIWMTVRIGVVSQLSPLRNKELFV